MTPRLDGGDRARVPVAWSAALVVAGVAPWVVPPGPVSAVLLSLGAALLVWVVARRSRKPSMPEAIRETAWEPVADRELWRLRTSVADTPGRLADLAAALADLGANIRTLHVHPCADGAVDEFVLHVPTGVTGAMLVRAASDAGGGNVGATPVDVRELEDVPTRTLTLASDLVHGRRELVGALRRVLGEVEIEWREQPEQSSGVDEHDGDALCVAAPGGGVLLLRRHAGSFTPSEFARARAMADLAASCRTLVRESEPLAVAGARLTVRPADRADAALVAEFHQRCSSAARYRRYLHSEPVAGATDVLRLLTPALGRTLLVFDSRDEVIAMGNLMYDGDVGEIGLLVRDDWQRRGIGSALAKKLVDEADSADIRTVSAHTHIDNTAIAHTLRAAGLKLVGVPEPGEWHWLRTVNGKAALTSG